LLFESTPKEPYVVVAVELLKINDEGAFLTIAKLLDVAKLPLLLPNEALVALPGLIKVKSAELPLELDCSLIVTILELPL